MPSQSSIEIVVALVLSVASLIVALLVRQTATKEYEQLEQRALNLERQLTVNMEKLLDVKQDISFLKSERSGNSDATLQYLKAKREEVVGSMTSLQQNAVRQQGGSNVPQSHETELANAPGAAQSVNPAQSEMSTSENSSSQVGDSGDDSPQSQADRLVPYSVDLVHRLYRDWCAALAKPEIPASLDVRLAEYAFLEPTPLQGGAATHVIRDTSKVGEFIRFSAVGADVGVVLPNPTAHFTPVVAHLFPGLTRDAYEGSGSDLTALRPVSVKRRSSSEWEAI